MKAISLWQPWASLIAAGVKRFETRSWSTYYTGPIAIHAAQTTAGINDCSMELWALCKRVLGDGWSDRGVLPLGAVVCTARLVGCYRVKRLVSGQPFVDLQSGRYMPPREERLAGDWSAGRFVWGLRDVVVLKPPLRARGKQGLFEIDLENPDPPAPERPSTRAPTTQRELWQ